MDFDLDFSRKERCGHGEVIYCASKTATQIHQIVKALLQNGQANILLTRLQEDKAQQALQGIDGVIYDACGQIAIVNLVEFAQNDKSVALVCAGTSDLFVLQECAMTLRAMGVAYKKYVDVGVAGLHRLLDKLDDIKKADLIICFAGFEGALPSVLGGLVDVPIIGVPVSVGYGTGAGGKAALLSMLNSCASGIAVVNIDNGFGAACFAAKMLKNLGGKYGKE